MKSALLDFLVFEVLLLGSAQEIKQDNFKVKDYGLPQGSSISCLGIFDNSALVDIVTITPDRHELLLYKNSNSKFVLTTKIQETNPIIGCMAADFDKDGKTDLLVMSGTEDGLTQMHIYRGNLTSFEKERITLPPSKDQVIICDYPDHNLVPDLYGLDENGKRSFWISSLDQPGGNLTFSIRSHHVDSHTYSSISSPHSNAFVDLDGDCLADLFVVAQDPTTGNRRFEVWANDQFTPFVLQHAASHPIRAGTGQVTFMDFDQDGNMDILFPVCYPPDSCAEDNSIHVLYNKQRGTCAQDPSSPKCRPDDRLCEADPEFSFSNFSDLAPGAAHVIIAKSMFAPHTFSVDLNGSSTSLTGAPLTIRAADLDLDGFSDLLVPLISYPPTGNGKPVYQLSVWINVPCTIYDCGAAATVAGRRTFRKQAEGNKALSALHDAHMGIFFDLEDDGTIDVVAIRRSGGLPQEGDQPLIHHTALTNTMEVDAGFITTVSSNGACYDWCGVGSREEFTKPVGALQYGAMIKFTQTSMLGKTWATTAVQLPQSAYLALVQPSFHFGLGRTRNLIPNFFTGFPVNQSRWWTCFKGIIPNSQLTIFPIPIDEPVEWQAEVIMHASLLSDVIVIWFGFLVALGVVIVVMKTRIQIREKLEMQHHDYYCGLE